MIKSVKVYDWDPENYYVYMLGITPADWTKQDAIACIKNHVTNYGYHRLGDNEGLCLVGYHDDIMNLIENYFGAEVNDTFLYSYNDFDWDNAENLETSNESTYVWEKADEKSIPFEDVIDVFKDYGYTEEEADDFWNSKWSDVSDTWESFPELEKMFGLKTVKSSRKSIKSNVKDHYLLGKQNFLTEHVFGIDDDGETEYEIDFGEELLNAEISIFDESETGFVSFDIEEHRAGRTSNKQVVFDYDDLENYIESCDIKNGVAIYEGENGNPVIATMGSNWTNTKTGEEGTDYNLLKVINYNAEPEDDDYIDSSRRINMKKNIKSGRFIKSGAGAGYNVILRGLSLDRNHVVITKIDKDGVYFDVPIKECILDKWIAEDYYYGVSSDGIELDGIEVMEYTDDDKRVEGGTAHCFSDLLYVNAEEWENGSISEDTIKEYVENELDSTVDIKAMYGGGWSHANLDEEFTLEGKYGILENDPYNDFNVLSVDVIAPNISENINWFFAHDHELEEIFFGEEEDDEEDYEDDEEDYEDEELTNSRKPKKSKHPDEVAKDNGADITCCRKPIKSGMSYQDALVGFTSMGKPWGDYWEMQQDWTAYVDSLERDGEVDYEEAKNWDNPCTPQTFKDWINE